jgi:hypothetical protein
MKQLEAQILSANNYTTTNGSVLDCSNVVAISAQVICTGTPTLTVKLQASNDPLLDTVTNWTDISSATVNMSSATASLIAKLDVCYHAIRAVSTPTGAGAQTIVVAADVAGSLNSKYFLLNDGTNANKYYVWFNVNSAGVDPAIAGRTAVPIALATGDSAATVGTAVASAIAALNSTNSFTTSGTTTVTVTNKVAGPFVPMSNGTASPGFTFAVTAPTGTTVVNIKTIGL